IEIIQPLSDVTAKEKGTATFTCKISKPDVPVTWFTNGNKVEPGVKMNISKDGNTHTLAIEGLKPED
ncbi:hypothetical protein HELRODRAFT_153086, partial [Helobdella robusta]|uniref:Ig-like domain-containing protein n=1 Tax=Helobdella robusta TaxID=6412 RepID=T1EKZ5_HELRO